jgi:hypothetical protein
MSSHVRDLSLEAIVTITRRVGHEFARMRGVLDFLEDAQRFGIGRLLCGPNTTRRYEVSVHVHQRLLV